MKIKLIDVQNLWRMRTTMAGTSNRLSWKLNILETPNLVAQLARRLRT